MNPTNPNNLIAGSNDYRVCCDFDGLNDGTGWAYYSFNGGQTWTNVQLPALTAVTGGSGTFRKLDSAGDPAITFSPDGVAYYANIVFSRDTAASGIVVSVSVDGGRTWSPPNMVSFNDAGNFFNDKEWIAAGNDGTVVVTWTRFNQGPQGAGYLASLSLNRAKNWNEFLQALEHWKVPSENLVYADVDGNIGWQAAGLAPIRPNWKGLLPVPGSRGEYEWQGFLPLAQLPNVFDIGI